MNRLKELRNKYHLSLRELQNYTGIDFSRLAVIEKTEANIELKTIEKLCNFYKVSSTYLFGRDGLISYYDEKNKQYFSMPYEQYKAVLTDDVVSFSIVDGCVRRLISIEGYNRIDSVYESISKGLEMRLNTERYLKLLNDLDDYDFNHQKEIILRFFEKQKVRRASSKK